jgi:hypothetical protein
MRSWQSLLTQYKVRQQDAGPFSGEIASAIAALQDAPWFERAGKPVPDDIDAIQVASWNDVLRIFDDHPRYSVKGHLEAPELEVIDALDLHPERIAWMSEGYDIARDTVRAIRWIPRSLPMLDSVNLGDHVHLYFRYLISEIVVQDVTTCTYFREQLAWWYAGHVPCGWEGEWPVGKHRVF